MGKTDTDIGPSSENISRKSKMISRRDFLKGSVAAAALAAAVAAGCSTTASPSVSPTLRPSQTPTAASTPTQTFPTLSPSPTSSPTASAAATATPSPTSAPTATAVGYMFFNPSQAATVKAICAQIIPGTPQDPGAVEAGADIYIDHALAGFYANQQQTYRRGLAAMDSYSQSQNQKNFAGLSATQQQSILTDMQNGKATGFYGPDAISFFGTLVQHVREGTFSDPVYGGNQNLVGWKMIGFPGAQITYGDPDMAIGADQSKKQPLLTLADSESIPMPMPKSGF